MRKSPTPEPTTTSSKGFKPTNERQFFECPCFNALPSACNKRDNGLANIFYEQMRDRLNSHGICPNRGLLIALKVAAIMARNIDKEDRHRIEQQLHDVLDLELSHNPSE